MKYLFASLLTALAVGITAASVSAHVTAARYPHRIVSMSPTATEDLFAIGAGKQVIAVDSDSDYPKSAPKTSLSAFTPNVEAVVAYHPDLVVISYSPNNFQQALEKAHIRVLLQPFAVTFKDAYAQMLQLGKVTGHVKEANALVARMKTRIAKIVAAAPKTSVSVYDELSPDYYSATGDSIIGQIFGLFGLKNIADAAPGASTSGAVQLSAEYIVASNPGLIVLADTRCCGVSRAQVAGRAGWNTIGAVKKGAIAVIDDSIASRWGPRLVNFVNAVALSLKTATK
ncbi:MAG TPA: ABC transporter substrate-binding protein [Gaiellaceae bacterium]|nr:ABC transporter substrate-binding protein [Gaiellaceae bacterium]